VIYRDKVIFSAALPYRRSLNPGTGSVLDPEGKPYATYGQMQKEDIWPGEPDNIVLGPEAPNQDWAHGFPVVDASRITEYLENNPRFDPHKHKPWRRVLIVLNQNNGQEYNFDSDGDGYGEFLPSGWWGTGSGNRYPPIVGPDNVLYFSNIYEKDSIPRGKVMGWNLSTKYLSIVGGEGAVDEPQALSGSGNNIYRNICCDRVGDWFSIQNPNSRDYFWTYNSPLNKLAPDYDAMWILYPGLSRLQGWYTGDSNSVNGIYHSHGDQNPIVPYNGRVFVHRSNAIISYGSGASRGKLPLLTIQPFEDPALQPPAIAETQSRLAEEIQKILEAGHLRPGYYSNGQFNIYRELADYYDNPGDTLYVLARAFHHLSPSLQDKLKVYLRSEFQAFFDPVMYSNTGWAEGASREGMPLPPEVEASLEQHQKEAGAGARWSWSYPQFNFYAMWKYALIFPQDAVRIYELAKGELQVPVPEAAEVGDNFAKKPYELNGYIAGYIGFLKLQEMAGMTGQDSQLRNRVIAERDRLMAIRANTFSKDTYWYEDDFHKRHLNIARNFIMLVPELGDYLHQNSLAKVRAAVEEYEYIAPYWFVARFESSPDEGVNSNLYNYNALFLAKAYALKEPREELARYLDAPAFVRGDLFYILNLITVLEAPH
jgi:hypothetical protein